MSNNNGATNMEHDANRSAALSPETLALINTHTSKVVQETLKSVLADIVGPLLQSVALTPEKIQALKAPYVNQSLKDREDRESAQTREQEAQNRKIRAEMQANCLHLDKNGKSAVCLIHNYPDRQPRGICPLCHDIIHPREWVIGAPDPKTGKSTAKLRDAHKDYRIVLAIESM